MQTREQRVALAFHRAVTDHIKTTKGYTPESQEIAGMVGTTKGNYSAILNGTRPVSISLILRWIRTVEGRQGWRIRFEAVADTYTIEVVS